MAETSLPWAGTSTGDAGPYSDDDWSDTWRKLFTGTRTTRGPLAGYENELEVSNVGSTIYVATGAALVDGKFYENDSQITLGTVTAANPSNFYTVVLRKDWTAQTVRAVLVGPSLGTPPTVTQTDGAIWEISLATIEANSVGPTYTITDTRAYARISISPFIVARQGGSSTDWNTVGNNTYIPGGSFMQFGVKNCPAGTTSVTFPISYGTKPIVLLTPQDAGAYYASVSNISTTGFDIAHNSGGALQVIWQAIGGA